MLQALDLLCPFYQYYIFCWGEYSCVSMYRIVIREPAERVLRGYDREIQRRFAKKIRKLSENPDIHGKPLRGSLHGLWELYFERKFRIIYSIDDEKNEVVIEAIKHKDEF
jgi:addiction module RelE/StbE family toxin